MREPYYSLPVRILLYVVPIFLIGLTLTTLGLLTQQHSNICDWSCSYPDMCQLGKEPFCPQSNLSNCFEYFLGDPSVILNLNTCSFFLATSTDVTLTLPFYGLFIYAVTLQNIEYVSVGNQSMTVSFGTDSYQLSENMDNSLTLVTERLHFSPQLSFSVEGTWDNGNALLFFSSIDILLWWVPFFLIGIILFNIYMIVIVIIGYSCKYKNNKDAAFRQSLILN